MNSKDNLYKTAVDKLNRENMVNLLKELISIKSPFFEETEIIEYLRGRLSYYNRLLTEIHSYEEKVITGFKGENLVVRLKGKGTGPKLLLNAHVDTVPLCGGWSVDPYAGFEKEGRIYGLGALDMKAGVVICIVLLEALVEAGIELSGDIIFTAVSNEEGPFGLGTHYTIMDGIINDCDYAVITEPAGPFAAIPEEFPCVALGSRGTAVYFVTVNGQSAHGANPERGINAVEDAATIITALYDRLDLGFHPLLGSGSICITNLQGGDKYLLVPEEASFTIYRHTVTGDADLALKEVEEIIGSLDIHSTVNVQLRELPHPDTYFKPWTVKRDSKLVLALENSTKAVLGKDLKPTYFRSESDANHIANRLKIPTVLFGPDGANYHAADEYVEIDSMIDATRVLLHTVIDLLY